MKVVSVIIFLLVGFATTAMAASKKLDNLRKLMNETGVQAYFIPASGPHQDDFGGRQDARLAFISGFSGSAGVGIVTLEEAAVWVDSRYHLQAEQQVDTSSWIIMKEGNVGVPKKGAWLESVLKKGSKVGFDPILVASTKITDLSGSLDNDHKLVPVEKNLVDVVWGDEKPPLNLVPLRPHTIEHSGKRVKDKVEEIRDELKKLNAEAVFVTMMDDVAWLFNLRGSDLGGTPVFYSYAMVSQKDLHLYLHPGRNITADIEEHFKNEGINKAIKIKNYLEVAKEFSEYVNSTTGKIVIPPVVNYAVASTVPPHRQIKQSLVGFMKAVKNEVEAEGMRKCHIRDGSAIIRYFHWLEENVDKMTITEYSGAQKLGEFRSELDKFQSYWSISAFGPNSAINHYFPGVDSRQITKKEIYLVDSGGQYLDGTTDTTRTIHLGTPSAFEKEAYTRVLKGFINVFTAIFPSGATEPIFDGMSRRYLWEIGLDFGHKTGHGIGSYLGVHEYPPMMGNKQDVTFPGLLANMFTSNEPGVYLDGKFGIRIEDVIQVVPVNTAFDFNGKGSLKFDIITMVPFQTKMINLDMMTHDEIAWINAYHAKCLEEVGDFLNKQELNSTYEWLVKATKPISK